VSVLAVAPAPKPVGYGQRVAELVDVAALVARGLDLGRLRFVPAPSDPLFGYARCPVRGCLNVTEHTATSLCTRCQHRYRRWSRVTDGGGLERFLVEVTQTRSEDLERLCLVCRTPGHERPVAAHGLGYSCLSQAKGRGQSVEAYIAGDDRWPPATPRATFGPCRMACDARACGGDGLCGEHLRHWRRAGRPAGAAFGAWREQVDEPLPASRYVDLSGLSGTVLWEFLFGLSVAIDGHRRTRVSDLRRVVSLIGERKVASIGELDVLGVRTDGVRLFVSWAQDRLRLAFSDPDSEWRKDVWDMRVSTSPRPTASTSRRSTSRGCASWPNSGAASRRRWCTPPPLAARSRRSASCRARCTAATTTASTRPRSDGRTSRCSWPGSRAHTAPDG
jgi:hypothetical protein